MRLALLSLLLCLAGCVGNLSGPRGIAETLAGRTVVFGPPGAGRGDALWQEWRADGSTVTGGPSVWHEKAGRWRVVDGTYCELFGRAARWTCWRITLSDEGRTIRFWEIPGDLGGLVVFHRDLEGRFLD